MIGELDLANDDWAQSTLRSAAPGGDVDLDLSGLVFVGLQGVCMLTEFCGELALDGRRIQISATSRAVDRVVDLSGGALYDTADITGFAPRTGARSPSLRPRDTPTT